MNSKASQNGITIVELLVGMMAAGVLVLTASIMLVNVSNACRRNRAGVDMQADGRVVMETIAQIVRSASYTNVDVYNLNDLRITVAGATKRIYSNGLNLLYVDSGGNHLPLISSITRSGSFPVRSFRYPRYFLSVPEGRYFLRR